MEFTSQIQIETRGSVHIARLPSHFDPRHETGLHNQPFESKAFGALLLAILARTPKSPTLVIDMSQYERCVGPSDGMMGDFVGLIKRVKAVGGRVIFVALPQLFVKKIDTMSVHWLFELVETLEELRVPNAG